MGEIRHLQFESLSALQDGELPGREAAEARAHLDACASCRADAASLARLEHELRLPPTLSCDLVAPFLSSARDGEADEADAAIASRHLAACEPCRAAAASWTAIEQLLAGPLASPSARVDQAMAALGRGARAPQGSRPSGVGPLGGIAWRGAVVAVLALAIAFGGTIGPSPRDQPVTTGPAASLVAAVQQVVLDVRTNTLYVAQPDAGAVNALNASTYALRAHIVVGGRPTALALSETANRVFVLDAASKRLTEIDTERNTVVGATQLQLVGTPTSVQVDNGKIVVSTVVAAKAPTASAAATVASGEVSVFDPGTKKLETVQSVSVAPQLVVADPAGRRTLLVSAATTNIVDASYRTIETIAGGVSAAFARGGERIAVLSAAGERARLSFYGEGAPAPVTLEGKATAVIGLPGGGFAVLLEVAGTGRIVVVDAEGRTSGTTDLAVSGRDLAYDDAARKFTVVGGSQVVSAALPTAVATGPSVSGAPSSALPSVTPTPVPSGTPVPSPSGSPAPSPSGTPTVSPKIPTVAGVPAGAVRISSDLYRLPLPDGRVPVLVATTAARIWFVDQRNQLAALDTATGEIFPVAQLPRDAILRGLAVGLTHVYAVDIKGRLFEVGITDEKVAAYPVPLTDVSAMTVAPEGTVWIAMPQSPQLLAFDRVIKKFEAINIGVPGSVALAADIGGRLWFSDGVSGVGSYDRKGGTVVQNAWPGRSAPSVLLPDAQGRVWAGASSGEIYLVNGGIAALVATAGRPISALALDRTGRAWYLAPAQQAFGFVYQPVNGSEPARLVAGPATSLGFNTASRAWLADPSGGFYLALGAQR